jgi:Bacterial Ig domain
MVQSGLLLLFLLVLSAEDAAADGLNIAITAPDDRSTVSGSVTVRGTAASTSLSKNVLFVEVQIDSGGWSRAEGTQQWSYTFDSSRLSNGWHTLRAHCSDGSVYSIVAAIDFQIDKGSATGSSLGIAVCVALAFAIGIIGIAAVFYYYTRSASGSFPQRAVASGPAPPGLSYPPSMQYIPSAPPPYPGRPAQGHYPIDDSPYYNPRPQHPGVSHSGPEGPRIYSQGYDSAATAGMALPPGMGGIIPSPPVVDHDGREATASTVEVLEVEDNIRQEVLEVDERQPAEAGGLLSEESQSPEPVELMPEDLPEPAASVTGTDRHSGVMRALLVMPRGLPLPLLGIMMHELADMILHAERRNTPGGSPLVLLKDRWYHADEMDLKDFMVEYNA